MTFKILARILVSFACPCLISYFLSEYINWTAKWEFFLNIFKHNKFTFYKIIAFKTLKSQYIFIKWKYKLHKWKHISDAWCNFLSEMLGGLPWVFTYCVYCATAYWTYALCQNCRILSKTWHCIFSLLE
jgi:hypothetical protein